MATNPKQNNQELKNNIIQLIESQEIISDRYVDICRIDEGAGDGCFSLVFTAKDMHTKKPVALKFFDPLSTDDYRLKCFHRESDILKELKGQKNILALVQEKTNFVIILDNKGMPFPIKLIFYCSELGQFNIKKNIYTNKVTPLTNILFFREMCKAVQRIHAREICHRDLKPGNFLVFNKTYVCLSDFGTARYFGKKGEPISDDYKGPVGDMRYVAPELLCGLHFSDVHNFCADLYSLGAILFELFTKTMLSAYVFRGDDLAFLMRDFHIISEKNRLKVFDALIDGFSKDRELPGIREFDPTIPKMIATEIDRLYKSIAHLNYKHREKDFQKIFLRINICEKVIRHHTKIEIWKKKRAERIDHARCTS